MVSRKDIADRLFALVNGSAPIPVGELRKDKYKRFPYTRGIYAAYNVDDVIIYIGQIRGLEQSSLKTRFWTSSDTAHCNKWWFNEIKSVRFQKFDHVGETQLNIIERLIIMAAGQPIYNDQDTDEITLDYYNWDKFTLS